jgi:hypothetical protein
MTSMMTNSTSVWHRLTSSADALLDLPPLEFIVPARPQVMNGLLQHQVSWIVGAPKVGKTVLAYYVAYLNCLGRFDLDDSRAIVSFDGAAECARAVDLVREAPYSRDIRCAIFENPFGSSDSRPNTVFLRQLKHLAETRPDLFIVATTRPKSYLRYEAEIGQTPHYCTPLPLTEWYSSDALARYSQLRRDTALTPKLLDRLVTPALIDDFIQHNVMPGTGKEREVLRTRFGSGIESVTLDKLAVFAERQSLGMLAVLLRLQEFAPVLPSAQEICALTGIDLMTEPHLSLVAVVYEFDGIKRLRFEHATTREAADILLRDLAEANGRRIGELIPMAESATWLRRAIDLWSAQQDIREGRWDVLRNRPEDVRLAVCPDLLALTSEPEAAVNLINALDYDAWTAQDLAYEIASGWPQYARSAAVRGLLSRIIDDPDVDGVYALLEALLYIRGEEVMDLWNKVDTALIALVRDMAELPRQLLLAVDGLAWRPPPAWHELGVWCRMLIERLVPQDDAWGFVRFMTGYHPEGVAYLQQRATDRIGELVSIDQGVVWTAGQANTAAWLVQWHFIHQCRARSQLAHQPWTDQQFLCSSFHPAMPDSGRDREAARLVESLTTGYVKEPGWGFFLSENIRAVSPSSYGIKTRLEAEKSLAAAQPGDTGVLAAVLTYSVNPALLSQVRSYFKDEKAIVGLLGALIEGLAVQGVRLLEPRFTYRRSLSAIYSTCDLDWAPLKSVIPSNDLLDNKGKFDVDGLIHRIEAAAVEHPARTDPRLGPMVVEVIRRVRCGDLRPLVPGAYALSDGGDSMALYRDLLEYSASRLSPVTD